MAIAVAGGKVEKRTQDIHKDPDFVIGRGISYVRAARIAEVTGMTSQQVVARIKQVPFPVPKICRRSVRECFYRTDFIVALFFLEGENCIFCLNPLGPRQYECCSRVCVSRYRQNDESTIAVKVPVSGHVARKLFRLALRDQMVPTGLASVLLKDRVELAHKQAGDFLLQKPQRAGLD